MKVVAYSCVAGVAVGSPSLDVLAKFKEFTAKWGHEYRGNEFGRRARFFEKNLQTIASLQQAETGTATYSYLGPFADFNEDEMAQRSGIFTAGVVDDAPRESLLINASLASSFDWVPKGAVNPIQNQGQCGSCWAFSTVANYEGAGFVSTGKLVKLSEQEIVDCDKTCEGCNGGLPSMALDWTSTHGGVGSEQAYPYHARDGSCKTVGSLAHNTGYKPISKNEDQIAQALVTYGPLSIAVDATPFQHYSGGIMQNPSCSKTRIDHAVNIVGYGQSGVQYFKIRNSWGVGWGEQGYIRLVRGECACALCTTVVTATGVTVSDHPTPTPPAPPPSCHDSSSWCPSLPNWECPYVASQCQKSCGCCGSNPPNYCAAAVVV